MELKLKKGKWNMQKQVSVKFSSCSSLDTAIHLQKTHLTDVFGSL